MAAGGQLKGGGKGRAVLVVGKGLGQEEGGSNNPGGWVVVCMAATWRQATHKKPAVCLLATNKGHIQQNFQAHSHVWSSFA